MGTPTGGPVPNGKSMADLTDSCTPHGEEIAVGSKLAKWQGSEALETFVLNLSVA
jgi:hypothetical protein